MHACMNSTGAKTAPANRTGVGFGNAKQDAILDAVMDKLDNINEQQIVIGAEVTRQTTIVQDLAADMDRLDGRVSEDTQRARKIK